MEDTQEKYQDIKDTSKLCTNCQSSKTELAKRWAIRVGITTTGICVILFFVFSGLALYNEKIAMDTILSILLAFFSIGISILFYFNADKAGKIFYHSSYDFMKEQSQLLGEINVKFGEKFDHLSTTILSLKEKKNEVQKEVQENQDSIIEELNAQLSDYKNKMSEMERELEKNSTATAEAIQLKRILEELRREQVKRDEKVKKYEEQLLYEKNKQHRLENEISNIYRNSRIKKHFRSTPITSSERASMAHLFENISSSAIKRALNAGKVREGTEFFSFLLEKDFCDATGTLTPWGEQILRQVMFEKDVN